MKSSFEYSENIVVSGVAGILALLFIAIMMPVISEKSHEHRPALLYYPGHIKTEKIELCGDSAWVDREGNHNRLADHTRKWVEPIVDKPK